MKFFLKTAVIKSARSLLKAGYLLPVNRKKVLFSAYEGRQYGCNPRYIFEALYEKRPDLDIVWVMNNPEMLPKKYRGKVRTVKFLSPSHIRELLTSRIIVSNLGIEPFLPKRKGQTFINTWHGGGAYKRVSWDMDIFPDDQKKYMAAMRDLRAASTDIFLASCQRFAEVSSTDFGVERKKFIPSGMPRNDRLVCRNTISTAELRKTICAKYDINPDSLLVLYAPTFRGTYREQTKLDLQICCPQVADVFREKFSRDVHFLFRSHVGKDMHAIDFKNMNVGISDFTSYPDMQDLLAIADVLITDYSSSIWDFSLSRKPAFLFMPDLEFYMKNYGFYTPLSDWPYPHAVNIDDFCSLITDYNEEANANRISRHLSLLGSYETGKARDKVIEIISSLTGA